MKKRFSVKTNSAKRSSVSELGSLTVRKSKKMFEGYKAFPIRGGGVKRCNIHCKNKFVLTQGIEIAKNLECVLTVFNIRR